MLYVKAKGGSLLAQKVTIRPADAYHFAWVLL